MVIEGFCGIGVCGGLFCFCVGDVEFVGDVGECFVEDLVIVVDCGVVDDFDDEFEVVGVEELEVVCVFC